MAADDGGSTVAHAARDVSLSVSQSAREIHRGRVSQKARAERTERDCCRGKRRRNETSGRSGGAVGRGRRGKEQM